MNKITSVNNIMNKKNKFKFIDKNNKRWDKDKILKIFFEILRIYINQNDREKKEDEYERIDDLENEKIEDFEKMKDYLLGLFINLKNEEDINIIFSLIDY